MAKTETNNIKLGFFVFAGLALLVAALFFIGNSGNMFGSDAELKVRFSNTYGLQKGNNVFFSGINAGTVKSIDLIDETTIEVTLLIDKDIMKHIPKNSLASIGTEGLMGNKVVNITPAAGETAKVADGDYLVVEKKANIDDMLETLSKSNDNIAAVSGALKNTAQQIESSRLLKVIDDKELSEDLKASMKNLSITMKNANQVTTELNGIVLRVKKGEGAAGLLLSDKKFAGDVRQTITNIENASGQIDRITGELNTLATTLNTAVNSKGPLNTILNDTTLTQKINSSLDNIQKGTDNFNQDMEALKHNFLFRGYFRKLEKEQAKKKD